MDSLFPWKHCFRQTFYLQNSRNEQKHARRRLPWEAFQTTSYTRILCNFHRNRCVHFLPTVNGTISSTETIHCQDKNLANTTNKDKPIAGVSKKNCENTRADKRPPGCFRSTYRPCTFTTRLADPLRVTRLIASFTIQMVKISRWCFVPVVWVS